MNRRMWVMVGSLPVTLVLTLGVMVSGVAWLLPVLALVELALVLGLIAVDSTAAIRDTEAFNRLAAKHGGLSKTDLARIREGLEPGGKDQPAAGPAELPAGRPKPVHPVSAVCESCELQPATTGVVVGGRPFRVCDGCVPVPACQDAGASAVGVLVLAPVVVGGVVGLAWAVNRLGDLVVPLKLVACVGIALGVVGLAVGGMVVTAAAAGGALYALDKRSERRALARVEVQAVTADRAPDMLGQVVAGEVVREVTR